MKTAKRISLIGCVIILITLVVLLCTDVGRRSYSSAVADYPESWLQVEPGMTSDEARKLVGAPWADGRHLKVVDRWRVIENGVELHMDLWFGGQNHGDSPIVRVSRWKRFLGLESEKHADPPW